LLAKKSAGLIEKEALAKKKRILNVEGRHVDFHPAIRPASQPASKIIERKMTLNNET
jgi:hypothetical protein